jgi:hypothetical protein
VLLQKGLVLRRFTALTSLTLFLGSTGRVYSQFGGRDFSQLEATTVKQVATIGQQLQEVVVVGCKPGREVAEALEAVVAPSCVIRQRVYTGPADV